MQQKQSDHRNWHPSHQPLLQEKNNTEHLPNKPSRDKKQSNHGRRPKIFTLWNLFAVIGIITVIVQCARYIVIPFLVMLNSLVGGGL